MISLLTITIDERTTPADLERIRRNIFEVVGEIQKSFPRQIANVSLVDGVSTPIAHGLGRRPTFVKESVVRGAPATAGLIIETSRDDRFVHLTASGWGATITVDVEVT